MLTPARIAAVGTIAISALSFALSFAALTDLARRSGVAVPVAWPLIVDGLIVVATVAVVALSGSVYAWLLLASGAAVSVAGNVVHALAPVGPMHTTIAACVAVVPPVALVAVTHLTVHLARHASPTRRRASHEPDEPQPHLEYEPADQWPAEDWSADSDEHDAWSDAPAYEGDAPGYEDDAWTEPRDVWADAPLVAPASAPVAVASPAVEHEIPGAAESSNFQRELAEQLMRDTGLSNYAIAQRAGKSEATIRRWRKAIEAEQHEQRTA
ncbi:helix-turn-helix domain-containing protein [Nocardia niigatensis]